MRGRTIAFDDGSLTSAGNATIFDMAMRSITIELPATTLRRLEQEARATGRSVAAIIRERLEVQGEPESSVYALTRDLARSLSGGRTMAATRERHKFTRS